MKFPLQRAMRRHADAPNVVGDLVNTLDQLAAQMLQDHHLYDFKVVREDGSPVTVVDIDFDARTVTLL